MSSPDNPPVAVPRDLEPFSVDARRQVWIVEGNRQNWYTVKNFPFGSSLAFSAATTSHLVFGVDDGSTSFHWRFLQGTATGTLRLVPRDRPDLVWEPDANGASPLNPYRGFPIQGLFPPPTTCTSSSNESDRWQMIRSTGTSSETKIAQGTYTISLYSPPDLLVCKVKQPISQNLLKPMMHTSQISTLLRPQH